MDCCHILEAGIQYEKLHNAVEKSMFRADIDSDSCSGCQDCTERCAFGAITMRSDPPAKKLKAFVESEKCYGCGVCAVGCKEEVITMKLTEN